MTIYFLEIMRKRQTDTHTPVDTYVFFLSPTVLHETSCHLPTNPREQSERAVLTGAGATVLVTQQLLLLLSWQTKLNRPREIWYQFSHKSSHTSPPRPGHGNVCPYGQLKGTNSARGEPGQVRLHSAPTTGTISAGKGSREHSTPPPK